MTHRRRSALVVWVALTLGLNAVMGVAQQQQTLDLSQFPPSLVESKQFQRWWWAFQQRAYPLNDIPEGVKERALEQIADANARFLLSKQSAPSTRWVNIGPAPILGGQIGNAGDTRPMSGRVADVAVNPNDPNHWLIGAAQGGIWETKDAGATWSPLTDNQESLAMGAIAFAPSDPRIIYAGTGEAAFSSDSYGGAGLLKSINGGLTWELIAKDTFAQTAFSDIKVDPQNPMIVLAATVSRARAGRGQDLPPNLVSGIFKSTNGGMSWRRTLTQQDATDLEVDSRDFNRQYAAIGNIQGLAAVANGVYRSTNAGENWIRINGPWQGNPNGIGRIELAIAPSNPNVLYVSIQDAINGAGNDRQLLGVWRTDNAWAANPANVVWTQIPRLHPELVPVVPNPPMVVPINAQFFYDFEMIVDPANPNALYLGGVRLYRCDPCNSTTTANDWTEVSRNGADPQNGIHVDQHAMAWTPSPSPAAALNLSRRTMSFEANEGQTDEQVRFLSRGQGYDLFLTDTEAVLQLRTPNRLRLALDFGLRNSEEESNRVSSPTVKEGFAHDVEALAYARATNTASQSAIIRMKLVGANRSPQIAGQDRLPGKSNYFIGNDPHEWRTGIPNYEKVRYENVWPGIDLAYYGHEQQLEYDFIVAPGADPQQIKLGFSGAHKLSLSRKGDLVMRTGGGEVRLLKPHIYQEVNGVRKEIRGRYVRQGKRQVGFHVAAYDRSRPLVIDPVLVYSTYLGGNGSDNGYDIAVDAAGNAYVTGDTSGGFPASGIIGMGDSTPGFDVFVTKFDATGTRTLYSTIIRGGSSDFGRGIAVDEGGNVYLTGLTNSADFPTVNAFQTTRRGFSDAFVAKLNPSGSALVYSSYLGGATGANGEDSASDIEVDDLGHAWVTGATNTNDFPTVNPIQPYPGRSGSSGNAFVTELDASGRTILFSTYLGGLNEDGAGGIAIGQNGNVYVTGGTDSTDFKPAPTGYQKNLSGSSDAYVVCIRRATHTLVYSTYLGGGASDGGSDIAVDSAGSAYVTGSTSSTNFPVRSALQANLSGVGNAFITKLLPNGSDLVYSTYFGGNISDGGRKIAVDASGNFLVTGVTSSNNLTPVPNPNPVQPGGYRGAGDAFVLKLNPAGNSILFLTYFGGSDSDVVRGMAVDSTGRNVWVIGGTQSTNFPTTPGVYQGNHNGGLIDAFVAKMNVEVAEQQRRLIVGNDGGVWSTTDGGQTWTEHNTNLSITQFYDGSVHPTNPNFALGGSQDNGTEKWTGANAWRWIEFGDGSANAISSRNPDTHWMVSRQNLQVRRTLDGGVNITGARNGIDITNTPFIARCEKCPANDDVFIAGTDNLWKTTNFFRDDQPTWVANGPEMGAAITALAFAASDTTCSTYAFGTANGRLRITSDGGQNWIDLDVGSDVPDRWVTDLAFDPKNRNVLYVTLSGFDESTPAQRGHVFKTTNALAVLPSWANVSPPVDLPHNTIVLDPLVPEMVYVGTDLGIWQSMDGGTNWAHSGPESGMPNVAVFDLQISAATKRVIAFTHGRGAFALTSADVADLAITKTHTPDRVLVGQRLTYTIEVKNLGRDTATGVVVNDTLPTSVTLVSAVASQGSCSGTTTVTCNLGNLAKDAVATITIVVTPTRAETITNTARVTSLAADPDLANNEASDRTTVGLAPSITRITPASASQGSSNLELKIEGASFAPGAVISFSPSAGIEVLAVPPTDPGFISSAEIRRRINILPNAPLGERQMFVTNPDGGSGGQRPFNVFTVTGSAPTITSLSPTSGPVGTQVTINGANFSATPSQNIVRFGSAQAAVTSASATRLVTTVPAGLAAGQVTVTVTVAGVVSNGVTFTVTVVVTGPRITGFQLSEFAEIESPTGIAIAPNGNLFVVDGGLGTIFRITPAGVRSVFAQLGAEDFGWIGPALDASGNLYVSHFAEGDGNAVRKITPSGVVSTFATGISGPAELTTDAQGNVYVSGSEAGRIYRITPAGAVSVYATGVIRPGPLVFNSSGELLVGDLATKRVLKVPPNGGMAVKFADVPGDPTALVFDPMGNLIVAIDTGDIAELYRVSSSGGVTQIGTNFGLIFGLTFDGAGNLYLADWLDSVIYKAVPTAAAAARVR